MPVFLKGEDELEDQLINNQVQGVSSLHTRRTQMELDDRSYSPSPTQHAYPVAGTHPMDSSRLKAIPGFRAGYLEACSRFSINSLEDSAW